MIVDLSSALRSALGKLSVALIVCLMASGCKPLPSTLKGGPEVPRPEEVMDFPTLFQQNCSGCHGSQGKDGPAYPLANPEYQALADEATLRQIVTHGMPGTLMPAFAVSQGGTLTDQQINALVTGMRAAWWRSGSRAAADLPPYHGDLQGDPAHGHQLYTADCASCHGETGHPEQGFAGSVADRTYLAMVSDQVLRTIIIAGRPDVGMPDWKGDVHGGEAAHSKMTDQQVTDVVAWLSSQRFDARAGAVPGGPSKDALDADHAAPPKTPAHAAGGSK